jgi:DNA-binding NarL/FixJ family response regulator
VTPREFDILRLALQGNAPWKIAAILEINPVNVRQYLSKLYGKFGVIDLYGLQGLFAKTGQVLGVLSSPASPALASRPRDKSC